MAEIRIRERSPSLHIEYEEDKRGRAIGTIGHVQVNWETCDCKVDRENKEITITLSQSPPESAA